MADGFDSTDSGDSDFVMPDEFSVFVTCPLCNTLYNFEDRQPLQTFCHHYFCEPCMRKIVADSRSFVCIVCGKYNNLDQRKLEFFPRSECMLGIMKGMCVDCKIRAGNKSCSVHCEKPKKLCPECLEKHRLDMVERTKDKLAELKDTVKRLCAKITISENELKDVTSNTDLYVVKNEDTVSECAEKMKQFKKTSEQEIKQSSAV